MPTRSFADAAGVRWEVFEVRRASEAPRGVSPGMEKGWLTFASATGKRRLAPFPAAWETVAETELERLCTTARVVESAPSGRQTTRGSGEQAALPVGQSSGRPRTREAEPVAEERELDDSPVRDVVRAFAHEARASKLPAIEAMMRLRALLSERYGGNDVEPVVRADATDMRRVRRWFVDAFYFEHRA